MSISVFVILAARAAAAPAHAPLCDADR
jgi:hypothetical protein